MRRALVLMMLAAVVAAACSSAPPREFAGYVREPGPAVDVVTLPDLSQGGAEFAMRAPAGDLLVVYFGFTNCPDVCPTTLADLRSALRRLDAPLAERVSLAMVSVDPERDADTLTPYVQTFVPGAHALLTDDPGLLRRAADPFGVSYLVTVDDDGEVEVGHTSHLFVVDDQGMLLLTWPFGISADDLAADLAQLFTDIDRAGA